MNDTELIGQIFGIIGLIIVVLSFQSKGNKGFFVMQAVGCMMFCLNFLLIGAVSGALYNFTNLIRGLMFAKNPKKPYKLVLTSLLYTACVIVSLVMVWGNILQVVLSVLVYLALIVMNFIMYNGNGKNIRICQLVFLSPSWLIYNVINFTLGGILCESFNMVSCIVAFIRYGKDGFEQ